MRYGRIVGLCAVLFTVLVGALTADEAHDGTVIWRLDFDEADLSMWTDGYYDSVHRGKSQGKRHMEISDGVLKLSTTLPNPYPNRDYAHFTFGEAPADPLVKGAKAWEGIPIVKAPILEVRMRRMTPKTGFGLVWHYQTHGGSSGSSYAFIHQPPGEWEVVRRNLYNEAEIVGPGSAKRLTGFSFYLNAEYLKECSGEVDYVRLREMNAEEWAEINKQLKPLRDFKMQPCSLRSLTRWGIGGVKLHTILDLTHGGHRVSVFSLSGKEFACFRTACF